VRALHLDLTLPVLRLGMGPFSFDPLEHFLGARLSDLLEPLMRGAVSQKRTDSGALVDLYPLMLPEGEGASVPLGALGELGFFNDSGLLVLTVPALSVPFVVSRLGSAVVRRSAPILASDGRTRLVELGVEWRAGARATFPLGGWGEIGVAASN
jgi:hypothetical protein